MKNKNIMIKIEENKDVRPSLSAMSREDLECLVEYLGEKKFRAKQITDWIYKSVGSINQMKNLPTKLIENLERMTRLHSMEIDTVQVSKRDDTRKYLFRLFDGQYVEGVFMKYKYGNTMCISSQAGCRMGCIFCASTIDGLKRDLFPHEMMDQILLAQSHTGERINHIVLMGSGEPFDNYHSVKSFIERVNSKDTLNISMRNITVSTCGIVPRIKEFANDLPQVNLAISLHEVDNISRSKLMPVNKSFSIEELMEACRYYVKTTKRRITFEYALAKGKNDSYDSMKNLANLIKDINCHVNLIPLNFVEEIGIKGSSRKAAEKSMETLKDLGIQATVRRELGSDINGACGQLRLLKRSINE